MLLFSDQISGRGKVFGGGRPPVEESQIFFLLPELARPVRKSEGFVFLVLIE